MWGVGNSLLVEQYALRFAAAYPGGVFWLRAGSGGREHQPMMTKKWSRATTTI
jgi:hypothetical protein